MNAMTKLLRAILRKLARLTIWRYRPGIIGVTGSVGKTSAKLAIQAVLEKGRSVRASPDNLNNEIGLPLAILGDWTRDELALVTHKTPPGTLRIRKAAFWAKVVFGAAWRVIVRSPDYPEILILEYGVDHPGDMRYLLSIARPNMGVVTAVGAIPAHVEHYSGPEEVAREKGKLIEHLSVGGFAVLNQDDPVVRNLQARTRARVLTFGFEKGAEVRVSRFENRVTRDGMPEGISFKLEHGGAFVPVRIPHAYGRANAYAAAAAAAIGIAFGMNLIAISDALATYAPADARMQVLRGVRSILLIDDTYNASPASLAFALEALMDLPGTRKIAVLGDMLEIGKYAAEAHERAGVLVAVTANVLFAVGPRAAMIADAAQEHGMKKGAIFSFPDARAATAALREFVTKGDVVLVKGSHAMRMDLVVQSLCAAGTTPELAPKTPLS